MAKLIIAVILSSLLTSCYYRGPLPLSPDWYCKAYATPKKAKLKCKHPIDFLGKDEQYVPPKRS